MHFILHNIGSPSAGVAASMRRQDRKKCTVQVNIDYIDWTRLNFVKSQTLTYKTDINGKTNS